MRTSTGPRSLYRPKTAPTSINLTAFGRELLKDYARRSGWSQSDIVEDLIRHPPADFAKRIELKERP
jgi:hypothetical protein